MADDVGKLVLRLTVGILMLLHGIAKMTSGVSGIEKMLEGVGLQVGRKHVHRHVHEHRARTT